MTARRRLVAFSVLLVLCLAGGAIAVVVAVRSSSTDTETTAGARNALTTARAAHQTVALVRLGDPGHPQADGQIAVADASSRRIRAREAMRCARVYYAGGNGICLARGKGFAAGYEAQIFDSSFRVRASVPVPGIPSRVRVSPDGRYGAVTLFVTGHAYADPGSFSTQTTLIDMRNGTKIADLEQFSVLQGTHRVTAIDVNFWGVTFARDSDTFYATLATGGKTYLLRGSVKARSARVIHENVECPSLSPDGTRIAFKRRTGSAERPWRLTVLDLATMRETSLAEPRSVDDQAEWLDDHRVLYEVDGAVWVVPADGSGRPVRYLAGASSPAVVR